MDLKIAAITIIILLIAGIGYFFFYRIDCDPNRDCTEKYFKACRYYKVNNQNSASLLDISFQGTADADVEITGDQKNGLCGIKITINKVTNEKDAWAAGTSMTCYSSFDSLRAGNALDRLRNYCTGTFADKALERCKISGKSTTYTGITSEYATCTGSFN